MYFRFTSLPELQHLSLADRRDLIRSSVGSSIILRIIARSVAFGAVLGSFEMVAIHALWLGNRFPAWITLLFTSILSALLIYRIYLTRIRGGLLTYLEQCRKHHRLPMCLNCAYDLQGTAGQTCPECGARIAPDVE